LQISDQSFSVGSVSNTFLYNGKEYDTNTGYYQYGFRQYDAQIGRWWVVDAMSEKYYSHSPYAYCMNNPVGSYDVAGLYTAQEFRQKNSEKFYKTWGSPGYYEGYNIFGMGGMSFGSGFENDWSYLAGPEGSAWVKNSDTAPSPENLSELGILSHVNKDGTIDIYLRFYLRKEYNENGEPVDGVSLSTWGLFILEGQNAGIKEAIADELVSFFMNAGKPWIWNIAETIYETANGRFFSLANTLAPTLSTGKLLSQALGGNSYDRTRALTNLGLQAALAVAFGKLAGGTSGANIGKGYAIITGTNIFGKEIANIATRMG
jgi:RHS repeat-associated protein